MSSPPRSQTQSSAVQDSYPFPDITRSTSHASSSASSSRASTPALEHHHSTSSACSSRRGSSFSSHGRPITPQESEIEHLEVVENNTKNAGSTPGLAPPMPFVPFDKLRLRSKDIVNEAQTPLEVAQARIKHAGSTPGNPPPAEMVSVTEVDPRPDPSSAFFVPAKTEFKIKDPPPTRRLSGQSQSTPHR